MEASSVIPSYGEKSLMYMNYLEIRRFARNDQW